jgi:hypothetical protein
MILVFSIWQKNCIINYMIPHEWGNKDLMKWTKEGVVSYLLSRNCHPEDENLSLIDSMAMNSSVH